MLIVHIPFNDRSRSGHPMKLTRSLIAAITLSAFSVGAFATSVSPGGSGVNGVLTDLGSFAAGTYNITATGIVDLVGNGTFQMQPDGLPVSTVTAPSYDYFNPSGSFLADGNPGAAGAGVLIGALIGTFSATPATPADWFLIGYSKQVTLGSAGHIYASVNDTYHDNNTGHFDVNVTAVPEPETYAMLLAGLGLMGAVARRKKKSLA
ncbi:MAG: PEP-CTERM sorting domain-containing protein [Propionivibrio sp.]|uniref:PEP-CTERM sorting domain-containing protein n=1 Tax=Candidatus Propionivibrio dominans TaxID=2954373 RepID=A0A9D7I7G1_9RHOO|nr:PEP-CTERM sorting domain-containing protein [Candidatus Propionivibrio dominans]